MRWPKSILAAGLWLATGCVTTTEIPPATGRFEPTERDHLLGRVAALLERRGYAVALVDRLDGVVVAGPGVRPGSRSPVRAAPGFVQVCLTEEGMAIVGIDGRARSGDGGWVAATQEEGAAALRREQRSLLEEVLEQQRWSLRFPAAPAARSPPGPAGRLPARAAIARGRPDAH